MQNVDYKTALLGYAREVKKLRDLQKTYARTGSQAHLMASMLQVKRVDGFTENILNCQ